MKLVYFKGKEPNFGDELNKIIWHQLLPRDFLNDAENEIFLGIGSILWDDLPRTSIKHVIGSGYGGYTAPPDVNDGTWNVVWVRGPRTAKALSLDPSLAITDSAVLLRATELPKPAQNIRVAFMPHFQSIERGNWATVCQMAGITFLDPREAPETLIAKIRGAELVLTEAMHGAIVADALRTPFVPFVPIRPEHRMKWDDWADSLNIKLEKHALISSTLADFYVANSQAYGSGPVSQFLRSSKSTKLINQAFATRAARYLRRIAENARPNMSSEEMISIATERSLDALHGFVKSRSG